MSLTWCLAPYHPSSHMNRQRSVVLSLLDMVVRGGQAGLTISWFLYGIQETRYCKISLRRRRIGAHACRLLCVSEGRDCRL